MKNKGLKIRFLIITIVAVLSFSVVSVSAAEKYMKTEIYQGSFLMFSRSIVEWKYDNTKITWAYPKQEAGWVFPNNITKDGVVKVIDTSAEKRFDFHYTVGAGVVSPWGNINVYNLPSVHKINIYKDGSYSKLKY